MSEFHLAGDIAECTTDGRPDLRFLLALERGGKGADCPGIVEFPERIGDGNPDILLAIRKEENQGFDRAGVADLPERPGSAAPHPPVGIGEEGEERFEIV